MGDESVFLALRDGLCVSVDGISWEPVPNVESVSIESDRPIYDEVLYTARRSEEQTIRVELLANEIDSILGTRHSTFYADDTPYAVVFDTRRSVFYPRLPRIWMYRRKWAPRRKRMRSRVVSEGIRAVIPNATLEPHISDGIDMPSTLTVRVV